MTTETISSTEEASSSATAGSVPNYDGESARCSAVCMGEHGARSGSRATLPKPYYQDAHATIYHADNRVLMPLLSGFDLLLADPPYGIGENSKRQSARATGKPRLNKNREYVADYGKYEWDNEPVEEWVMSLARRLCRWQIIWGGNFYQLPSASCWLVWDKENGESDFADCELAWTNLPKAVRRIRHMWNGMLRQGGEAREHPTQKPLRVMNWALEQAGDVQTVLDPWMGSGTTLFAAKLFGKTSVGIEREERYCEIAARRLEQGSLFTPAVAAAPVATVAGAGAVQAELQPRQAQNDQAHARRGENQ